jgi:predicted nucleic acid-binding protein
MSIFVDANILVRLSDTGSAAHAVCRRAIPLLLGKKQRLCVGSQVLIEYWAVATRPVAVNGLGFPPDIAEQELRDFDRWVNLLEEPADMAWRWRRLVNEYDVRGKQAHDARLVAFMQAHGLTDLLTLNPTDFARYEGIRCVLPGDVR